MNYDYDLIVIGSGPSGQKAAIAAAKFNKKVAIIERKMEIGGVCINTGTIPSKTIREVVIRLTGITERAFYGQSYRVKERITIDDLLARCHKVIKREINVLKSHLIRNKVDVKYGKSCFIDPHTVKYVSPDGEKMISGEKIVIAVGTKPYIPPDTVQVDNDYILDSDSILLMKKLPNTITIVGGGVIGMEYASIFATLGLRVTIVDRNKRLLRFVDSEIVDSLMHQMREAKTVFRLNEQIDKIEINPDEKQSVKINLKSAKVIKTEMALFSTGRVGATKDLALDKVGLSVDKKGLLKVNRNYQTEVEHIYAVGDVVGFPALASTSMEQGRQAAHHAFDHSCKILPGLFPYGLYSIPEISYIGETEEELTEKAIPYESGIARYKDTARGQILGDFSGVLKILVHRDSKRLLGVHAIGTGATELIHIGQAIIALDGTVDYLVDAVFNYPTLAECYKIAALEVYNKTRS
ncbi:MAG: Si-specific NAD(P)(+) transhydrogenase [candidate division Zixibacteria bacterium]|nr:Si-specific NAD(P)(+) transhydrogenase [candidate division Zixibacteria bacterium]